MATLLPISIAADTSLKRNVHKGALLVLDSTTGRTLTLPASTGKGDDYHVFIPTTVSSGSHVLAALGTDIIQGAVVIASDVSGVTCPTTATSDKMTLNGGTTGGASGTFVKFVDAKAGVWMVTGTLASVGAEATPFSAT